MEVKHEPPEEFVFELPPPDDDSEASQEEEEEEDEPLGICLLELLPSTPKDQFQQVRTQRKKKQSISGRSNKDLQKHSQPKPNHTCLTCDVKFSSKYLLNRHQIEFHGIVFKCDKCPYQTKFKHSMKMHQGMHVKSVNCETCQKKFAQYQLLKHHQMHNKHGIYATVPEETFGCDICEKLFSNPAYLKQHQKQIHDENEVKCEVCGKICRNRQNLHDHLRLHVKVECSICNKTFTKRAMPQHVRMHSAGKSFQCGICSYSTKRKDSLKDHLDRKHLKKKLVNRLTHKIVECTSCNEMIPKSTMADHLRSHSAEKIFECDLCNYSAKLKHHLKRHIEVIHLQKKLVNDSKGQEDSINIEMPDHLSSVTVKIEPPEEFVLELPAPDDDDSSEPEEEQEEQEEQEEEEEEDIDPKCTQFNVMEEPPDHLASHKGEKLDSNQPSKHRRQLKHKTVSCDKCGKSFSNPRSLKQHQRLEFYKCAACEAKFPCKLLLDNHRLQFHQSEFECDECPYQTKLKGYLTRHKRTHEKANLCSTCQAMFSHKNSLKVHQMQHRHGIYSTAPEVTFDCEKCDKSFSSSTYLRLHQKGVHDDVSVECKVCGKICKNQTALRDHQKVHKKKERNFRCDLCDYSANRKDLFRLHIERMHLLKNLVRDSKREDFTDFELLEKLQLKFAQPPEPTERNFKCDQCGSSYATLRKLKGHKKRVHVERLFQCPLCELAFKGKSDLKSHTSKVHNRPHTAAAAYSSFHPCTHCQLVLKSQSHLARHLRSCSEAISARSDLILHLLHLTSSSKANPARYECDLCGEIFRHKWRLRPHMTKTHSSKEMLHCSKCGVGFTTNQSWLRHSRSKVIHKCKVCKTKFSCKPLLGRHIRESHPPIEMFKCDKCPYQSIRKYDLKKHKRIHEKPIAC